LGASYAIAGKRWRRAANAQQVVKGQAMTPDEFEGLLRHPLPISDQPTTTPDEAAYHMGYALAMREFAWVVAHGYAPTERQIVQALTQTMRVYTAASSGKYVSGQRPDWLRGRADALRQIIRQRNDTPARD